MKHLLKLVAVLATPIATLAAQTSSTKGGPVRTVWGST